MTALVFEKHLHIFDLDDTLINTRRTYKNAQEAALVALFPQKQDSELAHLKKMLFWFCRQTGSGNPNLYFDLLIRSVVLDPSEWQLYLKKALEKYTVEFESNLVVDEKALHYIEQLKNQGKKIALVSNGDEKKQLRKLFITKLDRIFKKKETYISGQFHPAQKKPSPFLIQKACLDREILSGDAVYYGNTINDIIAANLAGVFSVFIQTTDFVDDIIPEIAKPKLQIQCFTDIK